MFVMFNTVFSVKVFSCLYIHFNLKKNNKYLEYYIISFTTTLENYFIQLVARASDTLGWKLAV